MPFLLWFMIMLDVAGLDYLLVLLICQNKRQIKKLLFISSFSLQVGKRHSSSFIWLIKQEAGDAKFTSHYLCLLLDVCAWALWSVGTWKAHGSKGMLCHLRERQFQLPHSFCIPWLAFSYKTSNMFHC